MGTYKVQKIQYPFLCRWKCMHCAKENSGFGKIHIQGQSDAYSSVSQKQEQRASDVAFNRAVLSLERECAHITSTVNEKHKYHQALKSVNSQCVACGRKQPWQASRGLLIFRYVCLGIAIAFYMLYIGCMMNGERSLVNGDVVYNDGGLSIWLSIGFCAFIIAFISSFIFSGVIKKKAFKRIATMDESFYPSIEFDCVPTKDDLEYFNAHPDIWICMNCKTENKKSRMTCSKCGASKGAL